MSNEPPTVIKKGWATYAWLGMVIIIVIVAGIGTLGVHEKAVTALLAAIAIWAGSVATVATLRSESKTGNVLAITAALSAGCGLIVKEADTIRRVFTDPNLEMLIAVVVLIAIICLTYTVYRWNREYGESENQPEGTSPGTVTKEESKD